MKNVSSFHGVWHHIYSITQDGGVLFYRISDRLVFFTIVSVYARAYKMTVLGVSIMFTHFHMMIQAVDLSQLRLFICQITAVFTRVINADRRRKGSLFRKPFGRAARYSEKEKRSSLIYLLNNPVEKKLCKRSIDDRWTFLAYGQSSFPFSEKLVKRNVRHTLRSACDVIDREEQAGRYLRPALLRRLFEPLTRSEQEQLTDYIIQRYQFINYEEALSLFDNFDALLIATEASAGKEFDVGETFDPSSDVPYLALCSAAAKMGLFDDWKLFHPGPGEQLKWARNLKIATGASESQVRKFLHLPLPAERSA